jgi:transcriptional regulator with XRE-family HTH domain
MTQDDLAAQSGVDQTTISSLETYRHTNPTTETKERLAKALGIAPSSLRFSRPEPAPSVRRRRDRAGHTNSSTAVAP